MLSAIKALRAQRLQAEQLLSEPVRRYLYDKRVLVSSWYPEKDAFEIFRAFATINMSGAGHKAWVDMGRLGALQHSREHYRHLVEARDAERLLSQAGVLFKAQHDTGSLTTTVTRGGSDLSSERAATVEVRDFGALCVEWSHMLAGYLTGLVQAAGGRAVEVKLMESDFVRRTVVYRLSWSDRGEP